MSADSTSITEHTSPETMTASNSPSAADRSPAVPSTTRTRTGAAAAARSAVAQVSWVGTGDYRQSSMT